MTRITKDQHDIQLGNHEEWFRVGRTFLDIANLVWLKVQEMFEVGARIRTMKGKSSASDISTLLDRMRYAGPFHLNAGYAIENLLKAVRVRRLKAEGKPVEQGLGPDRLPTSAHAYFDLAQHELGTLSQDEIDLLQRLSLFVTWAGRYPTAKKPEDVAAEGDLTSGGDLARIHALAERIIAKYESVG